METPTSQSNKRRKTTIVNGVSNHNSHGMEDANHTTTTTTEEEEMWEDVTRVENLHLLANANTISDTPRSSSKDTSRDNNGNANATKPKSMVESVETPERAVLKSKPSAVSSSSPTATTRASATTTTNASTTATTPITPTTTTTTPSSRNTPTTASSSRRNTRMQHRCEHLGDNMETGMTLVHPPQPEPPAVDILRKIHSSLTLKSIQKKFENWIKKYGEDNDSIRMIQGGRMEIFLQAQGKTSAAFDAILGTRLVPGAKEMVLEYCKNQANQDPRLRYKQYGYRYGNFSLLVSIGKCPVQTPHLDLVHPNFQFGLFLADQKTDGTLFVQDPDQLGRIKTVEDVVQLWNTNSAFGGGRDEIPSAIVAALKRNAGAQQLIRYFGDTLHPEQTLVEHMDSRRQLRAGTLASLPGGVVHAGPASKGVRSVLFFSGTPHENKTVDPYMPDSQYNGVTLAGHLVSILWRRDGIETKEREYLLRRLVQYVEQTSAKEIYALFGDGELQTFVATIQAKKYRPNKEQYIQQKALSRDMAYGHDPFSKTDVEIDTVDLTRVSIETESIEDGLFTPWEGQELPVVVYRRNSDQKIILRYLTDGPDDVNPDEYEGNLPEDSLTMKMNSTAKKAAKAAANPSSSKLNETPESPSFSASPKSKKGTPSPQKRQPKKFMTAVTSEELFDGTNGQVFDTDGNPIEIYFGRRMNKKKAGLK